MKFCLVFFLSAGAYFSSCSVLWAQATSSPQTAASSAENTPSPIDPDLLALREDINSKKKQLITENLKLTPQESAQFWPIYDRFTAELDRIQDDQLLLVQGYAKARGVLSHEQSIELIRRLLAIDTRVTELRSRYLPIVSKVLPGTKTAVFFQLDRRFCSAIELQLASRLPLVKTPG